MKTILEKFNLKDLVTIVTARVELPDLCVNIRAHSLLSPL
jgi:hypothetical protein